MAAMMIHHYPDQARQMGASSRYQSLLTQSLQSNDAELLACLGEQLLIGKKLAGDIRMAHRAISKSDELSGFMGAYVLGIILMRAKPDFAIKKFRKGRVAGHLASAVVEMTLFCNRIPVVGGIVRLLLRLFLMPQVAIAYRAKDTRRLWRFLDLQSGERAKKYFLSDIGPDRTHPFSRIDALIPAKSHLSS